MGLRTMLHLCETVYLLGPVGLIFALYNQRITRVEDMHKAIKEEEILMAEKKAAKEEEERL